MLTWQGLHPPVVIKSHKDSSSDCIEQVLGKSGRAFIINLLRTEYTISVSQTSMQSNSLVIHRPPTRQVSNTWHSIKHSRRPCKLACQQTNLNAYCLSLHSPAVRSTNIQQHTHTYNDCMDEVQHCGYHAIRRGFTVQHQSLAHELYHILQRHVISSNVLSVT